MDVVKAGRLYRQNDLRRGEDFGSAGGDGISIKSRVGKIAGGSSLRLNAHGRAQGFELLCDIRDNGNARFACCALSKDT